MPLLMTFQVNGILSVRKPARKVELEIVTTNHCPGKATKITAVFFQFLLTKSGSSKDFEHLLFSCSHFEKSGTLTKISTKKYIIISLCYKVT